MTATSRQQLTGDDQSGGADGGLGVACTPTSLGQSAASTCTVTLTQTAPAGGYGDAGQQQSSLTVPASVTVAAGATTATFSATAGPSRAIKRHRDGDPRQQFADSDHQSGGAGGGFGASLRSRESRPERGQHLHGHADPDRSGGRQSVTLASNNTSLTVPASVTVAAAARRPPSAPRRGPSRAINRDRNRDSRHQFAERPSAWWRRCWFRASLQSHQSRPERGQHLHGDADPDRSGGRHRSR